MHPEQHHRSRRRGFRLLATRSSRRIIDCFSLVFWCFKTALVVNIFRFSHEACEPVSVDMEKSASPCNEFMAASSCKPGRQRPTVHCRKPTLGEPMVHTDCSPSRQVECTTEETRLHPARTRSQTVRPDCSDLVHYGHATDIWKIVVTVSRKIRSSRKQTKHVVVHSSSRTNRLHDCTVCRTFPSLRLHLRIVGWRSLDLTGYLYKRHQPHCEPRRSPWI